MGPEFHSQCCNSLVSEVVSENESVADTDNVLEGFSFNRISDHKNVD